MTQPRKHRYADMMRRWLDDDSLEVEKYFNEVSGWRVTDHPLWNQNDEYRFKPRIIKCGDLEFPGPMRVAPESGVICWITTLFGAESVYWSDSQIKRYWLELGLIHDCKAAAEAHARALIALTESKP